MRVSSEVDGYGVSLLLILAAIVVWFIAERRRAKPSAPDHEPTPTKPPIPSGSRLARLHELREHGIITQEEHDQRRREILKDI